MADEYQQLGIGSTLSAELLADARAAGITEITALVASDNPAAVALLRRVLRVLDIRFEGHDLDPGGAPERSALATRQRRPRVDPSRLRTPTP